MTTLAEDQAAEEQLRRELVDSHPRMDSRLRTALAERGHGTEAVSAMSPEEQFREYCEYEGLIGWSSTLLAVAKSAGCKL